MNWDTEKEEFFSLGPSSFDIKKAKEIIAKQKKPQNVYVEMNDLKPFIPSPKNTSPFTVGIDLEKAKSAEIDLSVPLILAYLPRSGALFVIDGWHRVAKAILEDIPTLPGIILNKKDSKKICFSSESSLRIR